MRILAINPGSTSTKIAVFDDLKPVFTETLRHSSDELADYRNITDQYEFRISIIINSLNTAGIALESMNAVVGRGGLIKPIPGGVYEVNEAMLEDLHKGIMGEHASNLGGLIANKIASTIGKNVRAYIVDPVVVDEMHELARISGCPALPRASIFHALNQKAVARRYSREIGRKYTEIDLIVVHLGGGITVGAHRHGKVIDVNNGLDGDGPFSPERCGSVPVGALARLCFSGQYQLHQVKKYITGLGGLVAYLNTNDASSVEKMIDLNDEHAKLIYEAMAYQIAKEVGALATVFYGKLDAILITGGLAHSKMLIDWISSRISFIAPIKVYPGEDEMTALVEGVFYGVNGEVPIRTYL
ncbi:MAG: buk [Ignavibacteria bacterium]|nr:buk [Ignavibacteria bacterium]